MKNTLLSLKQLSLLSALLALVSCSGSFTGGGGFSVGGGASNGSDPGEVFTPSVSSSVMDLDNIYNIRFMNRMTAVDLEAEGLIDCTIPDDYLTDFATHIGCDDAALAAMFGLEDVYDLDDPESILLGAFDMEGGGGAITVAAMGNRTISAATASGSLKLSDDYCSEDFSSVSAGKRQAVVDYVQTYKTMENGSVLKICENLNMRENIRVEVKLNTASRHGYKMSAEQMNETLRLRARREFLYVFVNSFLAFGTDFIGMMQYLGLEVPDEVAQIFASNANRVQEGVDANKYQIRRVDDDGDDATVETKQFFNENKGNTYLFVEQFITPGEVKGNSPVIVEYEIDEEKLCKFITASQMETDPYGQQVELDPYQVEQLDSAVASCVQAAGEYLDRVKFEHKASGEKYVKVTYSDSPYTSSALTVFNLKYSVDHKSLMEIVLNDWKQVSIALMQHEVTENPDVAASINLNQEKIDILQSITMTGKFGIGGAITDLAAGVAIEESDLPAKLFLSVTEEVYVMVPETVSDVRLSALWETDPYQSAAVEFRESDGDLSFSLGATDDTVRIEHKRGQNLYQDYLGFNIQNLAFKFPPYELSEDDMFVFDISLDQLNTDIKIVKPTELSNLYFKRDSTIREYVQLSDIDISLQTLYVDDQQCQTDYNNPTYDQYGNFVGYPEVCENNKLFDLQSIDIAPWTARINGDISGLSSNYQGVISNASQGMIGPNDLFDFQFAAPQGNYLAGSVQTGNIWFAPKTQGGTIAPINSTLALTLNGVSDSLGPINLLDGAANGPESLGQRIQEQLADLMATFGGEIGARQTAFGVKTAGNFSGNLSCSDGSTRSISISLQRSIESINDPDSALNPQSNDTLNVTFDSGISGTVNVGSQNFAPNIQSSGYASLYGYDSYSNYVYTSGNISYTTDSNSIVQEMSVSLEGNMYDVNYMQNYVSCTGSAIRQ